MLQMLGIQPKKAYRTNLKNNLDRMRQSTNEDVRKVTRNQMIDLLYEYETEGNYEAKQKAGDLLKALEVKLKDGDFNSSRFLKEVMKGVRKRLDPNTEEGLTKGQKKGREDFGELYD